MDAVTLMARRLADRSAVLAMHGGMLGLDVERDGESDVVSVQLAFLIDEAEWLLDTMRELARVSAATVTLAASDAR